MIKHSYSIEDARREIKEIRERGYEEYIWTFLMDLLRGKDITPDECRTLVREWIEECQ